MIFCRIHTPGLKYHENPAHLVHPDRRSQMTHFQTRHLACAVLAFLFLAMPLASDAQDSLPIATDDAAKIMERADAYYRGLPEVSAFAEGI